MRQISVIGALAKEKVYLLEYDTHGIPEQVTIITSPISIQVTNVNPN